MARLTRLTMAVALLGGAAPAAAQTAEGDPKPKVEAPKAEAPKAEAPKAEAPKAEAPKAEATPEPPRPLTGFSFGSYGRMVAATDFKGRPGRDADLVAHGSRLDEGNYVELEMRRDDYWAITKTHTRLVATLAVASPMFQYTGKFSINMGVRNLYMEARGIGGSGFSAWVGSRMYRGDDVYLLDFWPLDNLNTVGGGARYDFSPNTYAAVHLGMNQPASPFFFQQVTRAAPLDQFGTSTVTILDRQKLIASAKLQHIIRVGEKGGLKGVLYGEIHQLPEGQQLDKAGKPLTLPGDLGGVFGAQLGAFTGERDTHLNLFFRYAKGLAAYGELATPTDLAADKSTAGARELVLALGGNVEAGAFGLLAGAYVRSFRNASAGLDYHDVDEAMAVVRPHLFFGELGGIALEASYQVQQRGVLAPGDSVTAKPGSGPVAGKMFRFGVMPFLSLAGRGDYSRPQLRLIYMVTPWNDGLRSLYPQDDVFSLATHKVEHFFGLGAEWWFNSSSYGG